MKKFNDLDQRVKMTALIEFEKNLKEKNR